MAAPMRDSSLDGGHRASAAKAETNFEYDDNEWDIGIGDLIIDLDADIEKTNEKTSGGGVGTTGMASAAASKTGKMAVEHSATVDKGLKMKIKRTKPGTKTSEAKHEIVKPGEQNGEPGSAVDKAKHPASAANQSASASAANSKRGSSGHRRDKAKDKHGTTPKPNVSEVNGVVRSPVQRVVFPVAVTGPGPPAVANAPGPPPPPPAAPKLPPAELVKSAPPSPAPPSVTPPTVPPTPPSSVDESKPSSPSSPPPAKKPKPALPSDPSEMVDVCVGTSVGTITEPDCLGPCEPGTSVTLEGIVWHETEGVLVVNVTWRGKTYVGTLLDCTRHDWAPPRFCDSPTSDLDARTPKGRGKRGRAATTSTTPTNDLSNFTETRSSVHSKLRSNSNGGGKGRRGPSSPTPFVPPRPDVTPGKRKPKAPEDEAPPKKTRPPPTPTSTSSSPPSSPVLLECPEPNCSKKYKHINGLKYHQSHAHGAADDEEAKESASMSETEETPSPAPQIKKEDQPSPVETPGPDTPTMSVDAPTPSPQPPTVPTPEAEVPSTLPVASTTTEKPVVKPGVLRFGAQEESLLTIPTVNQTRPIPLSVSPSITPLSQQPLVQPVQPVPAVPAPIQTAAVQLVIHPQPQSQPPVLPQQPPPSGLITQLSQPSTITQPLPQNSQVTAKVPQFKVKPASALMPEEKKNVKSLTHKKKNRKSPAGSPHPHPLDPPPLGLESTGREDVQSPAYSDISDDAAPLLEAEVDGSKSKPTNGEKKVEVGPGQSPHSLHNFGIFPYYTQPPYLVPSVTTENKSKDNASDKNLENKPGPEKEKKDGSSVGGEYQQKLLQQHYYPYGYVSGYPYNLEPGYPVAMVTSEEKNSIPKEEKSPGSNEACKQNIPPAATIHVPNPAKIKSEPGLKDQKHPNENHQILKESIEMKNQMNPAYLYSRQQQQQQQQDELRRYYIYPERRKDHSGQQDNNLGLKATPPPQAKPSIPVPSPKHKDKSSGEEKKEEKIKQEGVKPTMETQGPPPPPTSSYAYIHPSYMQSPHYGALSFDPGHPVYRGINPMLVPSYPNNPYLHPQLHAQIPRYHAPEDLSRQPGGPQKALDILQHHANQYYSSHKIHELQERAMKSPTPKTSTASASPSGGSGQNVGVLPGSQGPQVSPANTQASQSAPNKQSQGENKDNRSPPPQRHVHTHHHTHVGLGYPILAGQYPAPYGAAVLASQQAAAVASAVMNNPYSPK